MCEAAVATTDARRTDGPALPIRTAAALSADGLVITATDTDLRRRGEQRLPRGIRPQRRPRRAPPAACSCAARSIGSRGRRRCCRIGGAQGAAAPSGGTVATGAQRPGTGRGERVRRPNRAPSPRSRRGDRPVSRRPVSTPSDRQVRHPLPDRFRACRPSASTAVSFRVVHRLVRGNAIVSPPIQRPQPIRPPGSPLTASASWTARSAMFTARPIRAPIAAVPFRRANRTSPTG